MFMGVVRNDVIDWLIVCLSYSISNQWGGWQKKEEMFMGVVRNDVIDWLIDCLFILFNFKTMGHKRRSKCLWVWSEMM